MNHNEYYITTKDKTNMNDDLILHFSDVGKIPIPKGTVFVRKTRCTFREFTALAKGKKYYTNFVIPHWQREYGFERITNKHTVALLDLLFYE